MFRAILLFTEHFGYEPTNISAYRSHLFKVHLCVAKKFYQKDLGYTHPLSSRISMMSVLNMYL